MNVFDKASRWSMHVEPLAVSARLGELAGLRWRFQDWTQTQTTTSPEGRDQTADRVAVLEDLGQPGRLWLALMEFQTRHEPEKLDDLFAEAAQFRRTLRHGAERADKYAVMPILVYLTGECPPAAAVLDMRSPIGRGLLHAPLIWEVAKDSAAEALDRYEQGKLTWGILCSVPLMDGANEVALVTRWLALAEKVPEGSGKAYLKGVAMLFAGLAGRGQVWRPILEGWKMTESEIFNEWVAQSNYETSLANLKRAAMAILTTRFPGQVTPDDTRLVNDQPSLEVINDWLVGAGTLPTIDDFRAYIRR